jgi:hypothetical protein
MSWSLARSGIVELFPYILSYYLEEMFRDFKKGGYNLEGTNVDGQRLISILILIAIAYTISTTEGEKLRYTGMIEYVGRVAESRRSERRHSYFYIGLYADTWVKFWSNFQDLVMQLMNLSPNKRPFYQRGLRAMNLIQSRL